LESQWHVWQIWLLIDVVNGIFQGRDDFFAGGNMFIYYSVKQARDRDFRGPDFFFVKGVNRLPIRRYWAVWDEGGRYPNLIVELMSPSTAKFDQTIKKQIYQDIFQTAEYFLYDPDEKNLEGWRLLQGEYQKIHANERGWLWSEQLGCWLGPWHGAYLGIPADWIRAYDHLGRLVPLQRESAEAQVKEAQGQAQAAQAQAQAAQAQAAQALAENAALKAKLAELEKKS